MTKNFKLHTSNFTLFQSLELAGKVAHKLSFPCDFQTAFDGVTTVVDVLQSGCDDIHVVVGVNTAWDAETHEVVATETVLTCDRVTVGEDVTDFAGADTSLKVELAGQSLCRELFLRDVGQDLVSVDEDSVTASRTLVRDALFIQF